MSLAIPLVLLGAALVISAFVYMAYLTGRTLKMPDVARPCCAACRYPVEGLTSLHCPECGSDLRAVGILTPAIRRPLGPWLAIILWSLLLPIPSLVITRVLTSTVVPARTQREHVWNLGLLTPPAQVIEMVANSDRLVWPLGEGSGPDAALAADRADRLAFRILHTGRFLAPPGAVLRVDFDAEQWWTERQPKRRPLTELDEAAMLKFLEENSAAPREESPVRSKAAGALCGFIHTATDGQRSGPALHSLLSRAPVADHFSVTQNRMSSVSGPMPVTLLCFTAFWILLWLGGCVLLHRRFALTTS